MNDKQEYNGWKNRETWNCALWISNDYSLYKSAVEFMNTYKGKTPYKAFIEYAGLKEEKTPDNIKWYSNRLDYKELNEMMRDLP
jgi:hypothetical protein